MNPQASSQPSSVQNAPRRPSPWEGGVPRALRGLAPSLPSLPRLLPSPLHHPSPATLASPLSLEARECAPSSEPLCLLGPLPTTRATGSPCLAQFFSSFNTDCLVAQKATEAWAEQMVAPYPEHSRPHNSLPPLLRAPAQRVPYSEAFLPCHPPVTTLCKTLT